MTAIVALRTSAKRPAEQRVAAFIALARDQLTNLIPTAAWRLDTWDVTKEFVVRGKPRQSNRLHFFQRGTLVGCGAKATGSPFHPSFRDFAKAYIRHEHSAASICYQQIHARLSALACIEASFRALGREPSIHLLSPEVLTRATQIGTADLSPGTRYKRAADIERVYAFCQRRHLLAASFQWRHGAPSLVPGDRIGAEFAKRRAEKLPSRRALEALAHVYCQAQNLRDQILSAVCLICICSPWRASEVLQLRTDCEVVESRRENGREVQTFGLRAFPGKNNFPHVKWVLDIAADQVRGAVERLRASGLEARAIAAWYVKNPARMYLPPDLSHLREKKWLTGDEVAGLFDLGHRGRWIERSKKLDVETRIGAGGRREYEFTSLERFVLGQLPNDFPHQNGLSTHPYSEALILVRRGALRADTVGTGSRVMFEPIDINQFNRWLTGTPWIQSATSVFQRYGFTEEDLSSIKITTHSFRHWNNNLGHKKGLSQEDIALWSGRDPGQNKYYDHQTAAEFRMDLLEMARKAGGVGPIFEAADNLPEAALISRDEFLQGQIGSSHATALGACFHDYALQPCQNHGDCVTCEENGFIKGDQQHRAEIARMLGPTEMQLAAARTAMSEGDYGADLWVQEHERKARRMRLMLARHDDPGIPAGTVVTLPAAREDSEIEQAMRVRSEREAAGQGRA